MQALTADAGFLCERGSGRVEQVFSRAVNLYFPAQRQLLTLLCEEYDNAPNSARLALTHFDGLFRPGELVQFHPSGITVGDDKWIDTTSCHDWHMPTLLLSPERFRQIPWQRWSELIHQQLRENETLFLWRGENPFYQAMCHELQHRRNTLLRAMRKGTEIAPAVIRMMGLGIGLTPSADDYLVGLSIILFIAGHPAEKYKEAFCSALQSGRENTTLLSAITLEAAFKQRYRENIAGFISRMINEPNCFSIQSIANIKSIGSSSGCDMLYGMADACALSQIYGGNYVS
ncbi:DUF2877 domain-containing protein [Citrobacter farmeri]|uniref:DUF2877 domain-containing protein n=1 Tax=Citrobacter amalonaticus Y19 TaxID=1261127 RepID=A0A0F6TW96_CITAM|nr:DUF2877 domain-containing protein [Citrobacter amalonaticus]AKE59866.1 hypothetical protein F384_15510 [Citrobacter amalonaticus Y19]EKV5652912.1 DUF2877 domain-containing protein [Citrobacter farmeri]